MGNTDRTLARIEYKLDRLSADSLRHARKLTAALSGELASLTAQLRSDDQAAVDAAVTAARAVDLARIDELTKALAATLPGEVLTVEVPAPGEAAVLADTGETSDDLIAATPAPADDPAPAAAATETEALPTV